MAEKEKASPSEKAQPAKVEHLLIMSAIYGGIELVGWLYCSFQQMITTHDSLFGLLQGGTLVPSAMTAQQLLAFLQSNMDKDNKISWTVAIVCQILFLGTVMPRSPIHNRWLHRGVVVGSFILEVISDMWYSVATNTTLGGAFIWVFNWGGGGWLASLSYIVAMSAAATFLGLRAFHRLEKVLKVVFRPQAAAA